MLLQTRLSTRPEKNAAAVLLPLLLLFPPHDSRPDFSLARHDSDPLSLLLPVNALHLQIMLPVSPVSPLLPASPFRHTAGTSSPLVHSIPLMHRLSLVFLPCTVIKETVKENSVEVDVALSLT